MTSRDEYFDFEIVFENNFEIEIFQKECQREKVPPSEIV